MFLNDLTIPEAEVAYQKEIIRWGGRFMIFLGVAVFLYLVIKVIVEEQRDIREHNRFMARQRQGAVVGQAAFDQAQASERSTIIRQKKYIENLEDALIKQSTHIKCLETTMRELHFGDVADRIRKEIEDGTYESEDRS